MSGGAHASGSGSRADRRWLIDGIEVDIPRGWASIDQSQDAAVRQTREMLGLDRWSGIATGHQPGFWHAGILAKAVVASALSAQRGQGWLHLVADHDACDPDAVAYPGRRETGRNAADGAGRERDAAPAVRAARAHFAPPPAQGVAACSIGATPPRGVGLACPMPAASDAVAMRLGAVRDALLRADAGRGAAWRAVHANFSLLESAGALPRPTHAISASSLMRTPLGRACAMRIAEDPEACARAFNAAIAELPRVASPLRIDGERSEVPLWRLDAAGVRQRIDGRQLRQALRDGALELLPRAFLATGLVRALGIPFVHGTGGRTYERAGDAWWESALGRRLPPFAVATASLRFAPHALGIAEDGDGSASGGRLAWRDAWVDPARLDGLREDAERARLRVGIGALPRRSAARRAAYALMRERVHALRDGRRAELDALAQRDAQDRAARASRAAAADRTYAAAVHEAEALADLAASVAAAASAPSAASSASGSRR